MGTAGSDTAAVWTAAALVLATTCLSACVSATQVVRNRQAEIKHYQEAYFVLPKEDPRGVAPKAVEELRAMGLSVKTIDPDKPLEGLQGTGFLITRRGHLLTCAHVLGAAREATVWMGGARYEADLVDEDQDKDIALLKLRKTDAVSVTPVSFRSGARYEIGEEVFTIGFPISSLLGSSARFTKGSLSSTSGLKDNPDQVQVSAEVQPGSSGGPLFTQQGVVLGIVKGTVNPWAVVVQTGGALPQNVNFAIKANLAVEFLKNKQSDTYSQISFDSGLSIEDAQKTVVKIRSGILPPELEGKPALVVRVDYKSHWDMWYRFYYFVVSVYDFDSHELLFRAGQGRDNLVSTEDVVIKDTFAKVRQVLLKQ